MEEDCDHCHAKPWKYRVSEESHTSVDRRLCESCFIHAVPTLRGVFDLEERRSGDEGRGARRRGIA
jgi:hypothetical protein